VLEDFLSDYPGCLIVVSHDRYFMDRLVDHLLVFEGDGVIRDFPGNYAHYRLALEDEKEKARASSAATDTPVKNPSPETARTPTGDKRKMSYKERREFETLEKEMAQLEQEKQDATERMSRGDLPFQELEKLSMRIREIGELLDAKEMRWLELSELEP
jgi:ATP-binding cassette subfamily F protein uup